jgi:hypothetical protein
MGRKRSSLVGALTLRNRTEPSERSTYTLWRKSSWKWMQANRPAAPLWDAVRDSDQ